MTALFVCAYFVAINLPFVFALDDTTKTWTFNTTNAGNYTYDNTLVTVDDTGARPVTGVNKITNPAFTTDNTSWSLAAVSGSTTPAGWVVVPGNTTYSTTDFLAMKYEAKCAATSDLTTGLTSPDSGYHTYSDSGTACTAANSKAVVSVASGYPITNVSQTNAITRCSTVSVGGSAAHLISNNEWMTVARNAEAQAGNWSLGAVGSGYLFAGHNDNAPALAVVASTTDTGNNACAYTDTAGTTEAPANCPTNTANNTSGTAGNQKRVFTLSNGSYVWDVAGNVWEWTNDTIQGKDQPSNATPGFNWREFTALTTYGTLTYDKVRPLATAYDATYGVGRIYSDGTVSNTTVYGFLRGGSWPFTNNTGAFTLVLSFTPGTTDAYLGGFRCASAPVTISQSFSSSSGRSAGGNTITIGSYTDAKLTQSVNVGDTSTYDFSTYVYDSTSGNVGGTVSSSVAQLYYNGATVTTTYTDAGSGWWKLSGTITGANVAREFGLLVKTGKTIKTDDFTLSKTGTYSVYTTTAYTNAQVSSYDSFTGNATATGNSTVGYQICLDNGSACNYSSGSRWQHYTGGVWSNATDATQTNTAAQLTQVAMQALSVTSRKISVKAVMAFGGSDTPAITSLQIGMTTDTEVPTMGSFITPRDYTKDDNKPTLIYKKATDSTSGISSYSVSLDSGKNKNYSTSGIPATGDTTKSSYLYKDDSNAKVEYFNESDSDSTNDEIRVYFKGLNENELTEGKHSWKVTVTDLAGNENSSTQDFDLDKTSPGISELAIANVSTVKSGQTYTLSIFKRLPAFSGKIEDPSIGSLKENSDGSKDSFDKVSSGVDNINLTIKKYNGKKYISHFTKDYSVTSNRFYISTPYPLVDGQYEVTLTAKDKAGNTNSYPTFYLSMGNSSIFSSVTSFVSDLFSNKEKLKQDNHPTLFPSPTSETNALKINNQNPLPKSKNIFSWILSLFKNIFYK